MASSAGSDIRYMPILKGRAGELRALSEMNPATAAQLTPLVEVPLGVIDGESDDAEAVGVTDAAIGKFAGDLKKRWDSDWRIIFDASAVHGLQGSGPTTYLIGALARAGHAVTPTVRPSDPGSVVAGIGEAIREGGLGSACIRLVGDDLGDNDIPLAVAVDNTLDQLDLEPPSVDLILDFGALTDERNASFSARIARLVLGELPHGDEWRTLVCAAGAFPPDLNGVQPEVLTELPRHDASMWNMVSGRVRGRVPIFGDYAIAYPVPMAGVAFAPAPQLRFTTADNWLVMKGRRKDRRGASQFYDICARIAETESVDPDLSWGDAYVTQAARSSADGVQALVGTGNAMIWRAIGTSHHMAYVANRLATAGVP